MLSSWITVVLLTCYVYATHGADLLNAGGIVPVTKFGTKSYYFSYNLKLNFINSNQVCQELGMRLVSIPSQEVNDFLYHTINTANQDVRYWTSGTKLVDGKTWIWISTARPVTYTNWLPGQPDPTLEYCIELQLSKNTHLKWNNLDCNVALSFICESPDVDESGHVVPNNWQGAFADPSVSPNFPVYNYNRNSYYIGSQIAMTFLDADRFCQLIGMELVSIESVEENNYIYKIIRDSIAGVSFWSGGTSLIDSVNYYWLPSGQKVAYTNWLRGQPDNKNEQCIQLQFQRDVGLFWNDLNCAVPHYFICEAPSEKLARCPVVDHSRERSYIGNQCSVSPSVPRYTIGREKVSYSVAIQKCSNLGQKLVSIQNDAKHVAVSQAIEESGVINEQLWTSGNRIADKNTWRWLSGELMTYFVWNSQPVVGIEECVSVMKSGGVSRWYHGPCVHSYYYICESIEEVSNNNNYCHQPNINIFIDNDRQRVQI